MTTGYICDRCGRPFDDDDGPWALCEYYYCEKALQGWALCPYCANEFRAWMANDEKELRFANYGHDYGQIADMSEKSADCVRDGDAMSDIHESAREHSLESESVRERRYESQDVTGSAGRVTESPELLHDTREKLEADVRGFYDEHECDELLSMDFIDVIYGWLDRQASITERETKLRELYKFEENHREHVRSIEAVNQELNAQLADARESLDAVWSERDQWRDAYRDSEQMRLELVKDLEHARRWSDRWRDLVHRYEGLCDGLLDERDRLRGEAS